MSKYKVIPTSALLKSAVKRPGLKQTQIVSDKRPTIMIYKIRRVRHFCLTFIMNRQKCLFYRFSRSQAPACKGKIFFAPAKDFPASVRLPSREAGASPASAFPSLGLGTRKRENRFCTARLFLVPKPQLGNASAPEAPASVRLPSREAGASPASAFPSRGLGTRKLKFFNLRLCEISDKSYRFIPR